MAKARPATRSESDSIFSFFFRCFFCFFCFYFQEIESLGRHFHECQTPGLYDNGSVQFLHWPLLPLTLAHEVHRHASLGTEMKLFSRNVFYIRRADLRPSEATKKRGRGGSRVTPQRSKDDETSYLVLSTCKPILGSWTVRAYIHAC